MDEGRMTGEWLLGAEELPDEERDAARFRRELPWLSWW